MNIKAHFAGIKEQLAKRPDGSKKDHISISASGTVTVNTEGLLRSPAGQKQLQALKKLKDLS